MMRFTLTIISIKLSIQVVQAVRNDRQIESVQASNNKQTFLPVQLCFLKKKKKAKGVYYYYYYYCYTLVIDSSSAIPTDCNHWIFAGWQWDCCGWSNQDKKKSEIERQKRRVRRKELCLCVCVFMQLMGNYSTFALADVFFHPSSNRKDLLIFLLPPCFSGKLFFALADRNFGVVVGI